MKKLLTFLLTILLVTVIAFTPKAWAVATINGASVFSANCAACHINGGNIVRRGKNLKQKALKKYGMDSIEEITHLVENGKNAMPAYKDRLTKEQILDVSAYVLEQAEHGWK